MLNKSILTTIIGFLFGYFLYTIIDSNTLFIFLFGGMGYFVGLILDNADRRLQLDTFHFSSIASSHEIFYSNIIPEAVIIYSKFDNITSVLLDYRIEAKPEDYRLSVLKNLQEFNFRVIEDSSKTIFSLFIEYPEFNYPRITDSKKDLEKFFYDIRELSIDFQGTVQKIIPGLALSSINKPNIFGDQNQLISDNNTVSRSINPPEYRTGEKRYLSTFETRDELKPPEIQTETEDKILSDLMGTPSTANISSQSIARSLNDTADTNSRKQLKLLTTDKIKENSDQILAFQDNEYDTKHQESEKENKDEQVISDERRLSDQDNFAIADEEDSYEIVEGTLDEKEMPILAKLTENVRNEQKRQNINVDPDLNENYEIKGSSKQEI
ncbi:MAG: DUF2273 domain-containing protein [Candidatus Hodarchaeales archaeon]|jgi:hypothetical protein